MSIDYRRVFETVPSPCALLSPDFVILDMNLAFAHAVMHSKEAAIGRVVFDVVRDAAERGDDVDVHKLRVSLERVRRERIADATNIPVLDALGELQCIVHVAPTGVAQLEQRVRDEHAQLAETNVALEAATAELEAFCYSVAHDLRAPLRGIQGFSQALVEDHASQLDDQGRHYLERVAATALRMSELIDDLLALSRISRSPLTRSRVDLSALAHAIAADLDASSSRRVAVTIAPDLAVNADPRLMQIALENLLDNCWKFTARVAEPRVEVGVAVEDGVRAFFVRDNGAGFDEAHAAKLFAPFQRLHSEKEFAGTGIGLATVQRVVRRHGGRVWARAAVNSGATFYFTLPDN